MAAATSGVDHLDRQQRVEPPAGLGRRHDAAQRTVERRPRAEASDRPEQAGIARLAPHAADQFVADSGARRGIDPLQARQQAPALALHLRIQPGGLLAAQPQLADRPAARARAVGRWRNRRLHAARAPTTRPCSERHSRMRGRPRKSSALRRCATDPSPRRIPGRKHSPNRFSQRASSDADVRRPAATAISTSVNRRITASGHALLPKPIVCSTCATRFSGVISPPGLSNTDRIARSAAVTRWSGTAASAAGSPSWPTVSGPREIRDRSNQRRSARPEGRALDPIRLARADRRLRHPVRRGPESGAATHARSRAIRTRARGCRLR